MRSPYRGAFVSYVLVSLLLFSSAAFAETESETHTGQYLRFSMIPSPLSNGTVYQVGNGSAIIWPQGTFLSVYLYARGMAKSAQSTPAGYVFVTGLAALSGKSSAYFNHPTGGLSLLLSLNNQWKAFNATCTHAPCTVDYAGSQVQCPCHGAVFDPSNGNVLSGPAPTRLPQYDVMVQGNSLYVSNKIIN